MDLVFLVDIVIQSHSAYFVYDQQRGQYVLIDKLGAIRSIYFKELYPVSSAPLPKPTLNS